jgi:hypothetical protein
LGFQTQSKKSKAESFQRPRRLRVPNRAIYFPTTTRGAVKTLGPFDHGPAAKGKKSGAKLAKTFF